MERRNYSDGVRPSWVKRHDRTEPFLQVLTALDAEWQEIDVQAVRVSYTNRNNELVYTELAYREQDVKGEQPLLNSVVAIKLRMPPNSNGISRERIYLRGDNLGREQINSRETFQRFGTKERPLTQIVGHDSFAATSTYQGAAV